MPFHPSPNRLRIHRFTVLASCLRDWACCSPVQLFTPHLFTLFTLVCHQLIELVPGVLFALFMGSWSDVHGRKLPLLLPMAGTVLTCAVYIVFSVVQSMPAQYLLVASVPIGERTVQAWGTVLVHARSRPGVRSWSTHGPGLGYGAAASVH